MKRILLVLPLVLLCWAPAAHAQNVARHLRDPRHLIRHGARDRLDHRGRRDRLLPLHRRRRRRGARAADQDIRHARSDRRHRSAGRLAGLHRHHRRRVQMCAPHRRPAHDGGPRRRGHRDRNLRAVDPAPQRSGRLRDALLCDGVDRGRAPTGRGRLLAFHRHEAAIACASASWHARPRSRRRSSWTSEAGARARRTPPTPPAGCAATGRTRSSSPTRPGPEPGTTRSRSSGSTTRSGARRSRSARRPASAPSPTTERPTVIASRPPRATACTCGWRARRPG